MLDFQDPLKTSKDRSSNLRAGNIFTTLFPLEIGLSGACVALSLL